MSDIAATLRGLSYGSDRCPECNAERQGGSPHAPHTCVTMREAANMIETLVTLADEGSEAFIMQWKKRAKRAEAELEALRQERTEAFKADLRPNQIAFAKECRRRIASAELLALDVERTLAAVLVPGAQYVTAETLELVGPGWTFTRHSHPGGGFTIGVELPPEGATTTGREVES